MIILYKGIDSTEKVGLPWDFALTRALVMPMIYHTSVYLILDCIQPIGSRTVNHTSGCLFLSHPCARMYNCTGTCSSTWRHDAWSCLSPSQHVLDRWCPSTSSGLSSLVFKVISLLLFSKIFP